jgi:alpha-L-rhamnosidase
MFMMAGELVLMCAVLQAAEVVNLRCEYLATPLGIDSEKPRLSWEIEAEDGSRLRGVRQEAYQVLVASKEALLAGNKSDLWDSGKVSSDQQNQVVYTGKPLASTMRCYWKVKSWLVGSGGSQVTDWSKPASWTMGLLKSEDWKAKWIGLDDVIPEDAFDREITEGKLVIKKAMYSSEDKSKAVDLTEKFNAMIDKGTLGATITPQALGVDPGKGRQHLAVDYDYNGKPYSMETPTAHTLGDVYLPAGTMYLDTPEGQKERRRWAIPRQFRKAFQVERTVKQATLTVTALGLYEFRLNGKRVGDHLLAPEWTDYNKRVQYQTFDVTGLIKAGGNAMGAIVGNGWYCGGWMFWQKTLKPIYGKDPSLLAQLDLEYADGSRATIATDESWRGTTDGPARFAGIYEGEIYDARREMPGWDAAGYDDSNWKPALVRVQKEEPSNSAQRNPEPLAFQPGKLVWQRSDPIRKEKEIVPIAITEPRPGIFVADMGQNFSGWTRLKVNAPAGTRLTLQHGEILNPDGTVYIDNLRAGHFGKGDRQIDRYFCKGGDETFEPHFTYHGYRYVEIHGLPRKPEVQEVTGIVFHTGFRKVGEFTCSNPLLNRFVENIQWSQRCNVMGIPTDCNQRDERCGYTGDMNFFMPAALYNFDMAPFFNKWLVDVEQAQMPGGWFPDHAPFYGPGGGPSVGWSDAGVLCPYRMYREYGDTEVIREHYASMKRSLEHLISTANPDGTRGGHEKDKGRAWHIGLTDHLKAGGGNKVSELTAGTAYLAMNAKAMSEMARAIGEEADATAFDNLAKKTAEAFAATLIDAEGRIHSDSQTGYALAFSEGLVPAEKKALTSERFKATVASEKYHLAVGFRGGPCLLQGLEQAGLPDLAYKLLLQETYPSWLWPVTVGATTIWENYGSLAPNGKIGDPRMNSFSHYAHGAVGGFIFGHVGGIRPETPGYRRILIKPVIRADLTWAKTRYDSIRGRIATAWKVDDGKLELDVTIPVNTTATLHVPAASGSGVTENGKPADKSEGVKLLRSEKDEQVFEIGSGSYHFRSVLP